MKTYIWAVDAGHEWLAVKISELVELGIEHKISEYSYVKGGTAYLEGDVDAAIFCEAYREAHGVSPKTKQGKHWDVQPLRRFDRYKTVVQAAMTQEDRELFATPGDTLSDYVNKMNSWNAIFKTAPVTFPLDAQGAQTIASKLDGELSPENLSCDGEIPAREVERKYNFLTTVVDELNLYCDANGIARPKIYEA